MEWNVWVLPSPAFLCRHQAMSSALQMENMVIKTVIMVASGCLFLRIFAIGDKDSIEKRPAPQNMDNNTNC